LSTEKEDRELAQSDGQEVAIESNVPESPAQIQETESLSIPENANGNETESAVAEDLQTSDLQHEEIAQEVENPQDQIEVGQSPIVEAIETVKLSAEDIEARVRENEEQRAKYLLELQEIENHREDLSADIERIISVREDLNQWTSARKESFAWKLTESLRKHEKDLATDEQRVKDFSANEPDLDYEFGKKLRIWVMKSIGFPALILSTIALVLELARRQSTFVEAPDPNNPAASIQVRSVDLWLQENLGLTHLQIISTLISLMIVIFISVLFAHSRKSSQFRLVVATESLVTKVMEQAVHSIKNERERVDSLHPQVPQILELLSLGLHQPWIIDQKNLTFQGETPNASKLPESLDISIPTEKSSRRVFPQLVLRAMNILQQPGWREKAFEDAIQRLSESAGFGHSDNSLRELDEDQRRSGKRQILISLQDKESILTELGEKLVKDFSSSVQTKVLPLAQPDVISLRPDLLAHLELTDNLVGNSDENVSPWERRLSEIAGAGSPWAPGTYSARGQMAAKHERKPESVFIATDRAAQYAHGDVTAFREVNAGTRPFEVSIRVDLSEWSHPEELAIFQDYEPSEEELKSRELLKTANSEEETPSSAQDRDTGVAF
jgi:hypothetical protein